MTKKDQKKPKKRISKKDVNDWKKKLIESMKLPVSRV